jgi:UDP-N-acetylmuramoyl-tripeptide--D-alanyl-D-alanine ligase
MFPLLAKTFADLFTTEQVLLYLSLSAVNGLILFFSSMKFLLVLQQCGYHGTKYFKWLGNKDTPYMRRLMLLCLLALLFFCVLNMCFEPILGAEIASYAGLFSYVLFAITYIKTESRINAKVPLKKTKRLVRLCITYSIFLVAVTFGLMVLVNYLSFVIGDMVVALLRYCVLCVLPILTPFILFLAYCFNEPYEEVSRRRYLRIATRKLARTEVLKIGITGSYAKTTVKEILRTILSQKYRVLATPASYNTPLGIALTVRHLDSSHDVFIAEMGARSKGDIKRLANLVKPTYGILTGVNNQHLETFGSIETTMDTKFELFECMGADGVGFFSSDNQNAVTLSERFEGEKYLAGVTDRDNLVTATDIKTDVHGMSFTLNIKGERPVKCTTVLLGTHSVKNICLAASVAYKIGLTPKEIAQGINRIQSIGHRLELMPNNKNIVIIDDSYNSNPDGVNAAMEVLDTFKGRKIVLTPGLVELGKIENLANFEMGKTLAGHADKVIIVGVHNAAMLINGLVEGGMDRENIIFARTLKKGNEILNELMKEGDVVLFENDLPDNYN